MKRKRNIRQILQGADEQTAQQIAELSPPADAETRARLYARVQERLEQPETMPEETFTVTTVHRTPRRKIAAAAACLVMCGGIVGGVFLTRQDGISEPDLPQEQLAPAQEVTTSEETVITSEETVTTVQETAPVQKPVKEWTQEEVYALCMDSIENLMEYGRFSCSSSMTTTLDHSILLEMQGVLELDFEAEIYNSCVTHIMQNAETAIQENQWYYADGCQLSLVDYQIPEGTQDIGTFTEMEESFVFSGGGNLLDFPTNTTFWTETYLSDFSKWEIIGTDVFDYVFIEDPTTNITHEMQRDCIVLEAAGGVFEDLFEADSNRVLVDAETGMWLRVECYNADGNAVGIAKLNDLKFGSDAEITHPYNIGQEILNGDYEFDTEYELPDSYLIHPMAYEETTTEMTETGAEG